MGLSVNEFTYTGDNEFDLNFALGYTSRGDVRCYVEAEFPIDVEFNWITDSRVVIVPTDVNIGDKLVFTRTVSKVSLPVDLTQPGNLTREAVERSVLHALYAFHEILDGRFGDLVQVDDAVYTRVQNAVSSALENFLFKARFKTEFLLETRNSSGPVYWQTGDYLVDTSEAQVYVIQPPSEAVEILVSHNGQVIYAAEISDTGSVSASTTSQVTTLPGEITFSITGDNYTTGLDARVVLPAYSDSVVDFDTVLSDYVQIFETARTT